MHASRPELDDVTDSLLRASQVLVAVASRSLAAVAGEVTLAQFRALVVLHSRGPQAVQALAEELAVVPSTASRVCDRLVEKGLIERGPEEDDRRQMRLAVTDEGASVVAAVRRRRRAELRRVVAAMPERQARALAASLEAFNRASGEWPEQDWYLGWG